MTDELFEVDHGDLDAVEEKEPEKKTNKKKVVTLGDSVTGIEFEAFEPPKVPKGRPPVNGLKLQYRIDPERSTVIQCRWNMQQQDWHDYVLCDDKSDARSKLGILTTASWRLNPPVGVAGKRMTK